MPRKKKMYITYRYDVYEHRVVDGDTIFVEIDFDTIDRKNQFVGPNDLGFDMKLKKENLHCNSVQGWFCRMSGIDTAEKNTEAGVRIREFINLWVEMNEWQVVYLKKGAFSNRFIGIPILKSTVIPDNIRPNVMSHPDGSLPRKLWELGLAIEYSGKKAKGEWDQKGLDIALINANRAIAELEEKKVLTSQIN